MTIVKHLEYIWQYYRDEPALNDSGDIIDFPDNTDSALFQFKQKITGQREDDGINDVEVMVLLKYLSNF